MMKKSLLSCALLASLFTAQAFAAEVKIGVIMPLSGEYAGYGQSALAGIELANKMLPNAGAHSISIIKLDSKGDKLESQNAATRLVSNDKVSAVIGEMLTGNTVQIMSVTEGKNIPLIAPAATSDKMLDGKKYSARVCFMDSFQGQSLAKYVHSALGHKKAIVVKDQSTDYSLGLAKAFTQQFKALGGEILADYKIQGTDKDFKALIAQISSQDAQFLYLPLYYQQASLFIKQARAAGLKIAAGSADGTADEKFIELAGEASEDYLYTDSFDANYPPTELSKEFIAKYSAQNNGALPSNFTAMGADAYFVLQEAIAKCEDASSECINNEMHKTSAFKGVSGVINIDATGNASRSLIIKEIKGGKQLYKDIVQP